jgi:hypothetical protein
MISLFFILQHSTTVLHKKWYFHCNEEPDPFTSAYIASLILALKKVAVIQGNFFWGSSVR